MILRGALVCQESRGFAPLIPGRHDDVLQSPQQRLLCFGHDQLDGLGLGAKTLVGVNTGSSPLFPNKSLSVERHVDLLAKMSQALPDARFALLGGPGETEKNAEREGASKAGREAWRCCPSTA